MPVQYAEFLRSALVKHKYKELMPSLSDLLDPDKYGLEPEVAFLLYRPILSRVPFPDTPSQRNPPPEDGEIPDGQEAPMEVEQGAHFAAGFVRQCTAKSYPPTYYVCGGSHTLVTQLLAGRLRHSL